MLFRAELLILPDDSDYAANVGTTSGKFESDFALKKYGSTYICGSGSTKIDINTALGNVSILPKQAETIMVTVLCLKTAGNAIREGVFNYEYGNIS